VISTLFGALEHRTYSNILYCRLYKGIQLDRFGFLFGHRFGQLVFGWWEISTPKACLPILYFKDGLNLLLGRKINENNLFLCFIFEYSVHLCRHEHLNQQRLFEVNRSLTSLHLLCSGSWSMQAAFLLNEIKSEDVLRLPMQYTSAIIRSLGR